MNDLFQGPHFKSLLKRQFKNSYIGREILEEQIELAEFSMALYFVNEELSLKISIQQLQEIIARDFLAYTFLLRFGMDHPRTKKVIQKAIIKYYSRAFGLQ